MPERNQMGFLTTALLVFLILLVPVVGEIIVILLILQDDLSAGEKLLWIVLSLVLFKIGPLLYLIFGQRRNRLFGGTRPAF